MTNKRETPREGNTARERTIESSFFFQANKGVELAAAMMLRRFSVKLFLWDHVCGKKRISSMAIVNLLSSN